MTTTLNIKHSTGLLLTSGNTPKRFWNELKIDWLTPDEFRKLHEPKVAVISLGLHCGCNRIANTLPELEALVNVACEHGNHFVRVEP